MDADAQSRLAPGAIAAVPEARMVRALERTRRRGPSCARVIQRMLAMAACVWRNWVTSAAVKRSLTAFGN